MAFVLTFVFAVGNSFAGTIQNDAFWKDDSGNPIFSQGGGILKAGERYYWYGVRYTAAAEYVADPASRKDRAIFQAVTCYSSTDLAHWKFEGRVLAGDQVGRGWFGRIGVVFNKISGKYVLAGQGAAPNGPSGEYFATSDAPSGPFKFARVQSDLPFIVNGATGDQTTFQDDDGSAYVICTNTKGRNHLYVAPLRPSDFLNIESAKEVFQGRGREGNCMFKYGRRYYFCSSELHGWNASPTYVISATNINGPYGPESLLKGSELDFSHVSQSGFFVTVRGTQQTTVVFAGDRWCDFAGNGIGFNQWCPLSFEGNTPAFHSMSQWDLDAKTGQWSVGAGNNYVLNPGFEADRVRQHTLAGWTGATNLPNEDPNGNAAKGEAHGGNFCMQQKAAQDYTATLSQNITNLSPGAYTLNAWFKSSGGQKSAVLAVKGFGGADVSVSLARSAANWTQVSMPNIRITRGQCEVAILSDAGANDWVEVDDVSLVRSGP